MLPLDIISKLSNLATQRDQMRPVGKWDHDTYKSMMHELKEISEGLNMPARALSILTEVLYGGG